MNDQELNLPLGLSNQESFEAEASSENVQKNSEIELSEIIQDEDMSSNQEELYDKENYPKLDTIKRRERNIISSRRYRAKRRERMKILDDTNKQLSFQIQGTEKELDVMKKMIYKFVGHASVCDACGNLQIKFE